MSMGTTFGISRGEPTGCSRKCHKGDSWRREKVSVLMVPDFSAHTLTRTLSKEGANSRAAMEVPDQ